MAARTNICEENSHNTKRGLAQAQEQEAERDPAPWGSCIVSAYAKRSLRTSSHGCFVTGHVRWRL